MENKEFYEELENIYSHQELPPEINHFYKQYKVNNIREARELEGAIQEKLLTNQAINIEVKSWQIKENIILIFTNIGTFTIERTANYEVILKPSYNILEFYEMLKSNNLFLKKKYQKNVEGYYKTDKEEYLFNDYLKAYYWYQLLKNPKRFYLYLTNTTNTNLWFNIRRENLVSLECLSNQDFNDFSNTKKYQESKPETHFLKQLHNRFKEIAKINPYLLFSIAINQEESYLPYIMNNLEIFKKFILEETTKYTDSGSGMKQAYRFLKKINLIKYFTKEELLQLYKKNPSLYYHLDKERFTLLTKEIENKSPLVQLDKNSSKKVHIRYQRFELFDYCPVDCILKETPIKKYFFLYFLEYNQTISKLYKSYYKSYEKITLKKGEIPNLEDFCKCLFQPRNLFKVYQNQKLNGQDLRNFTKLTDYYGEATKQNQILVEKACRQKAIEFYNNMINSQISKSTFEQFLKQNNLNEQTIFSYIINYKFLYSKEKSTLFKILNNYYGHFLKLVDIITLLKEMIERNLELEVFLKEKGISKKNFSIVYNYFEENYPKLYQKIFYQRNKEKQMKILNQVYLGCQILSREEKNIELSQQFLKECSLDELKNTELYDLLVDKNLIKDEMKNKKLKKTLL